MFGPFCCAALSVLSSFVIILIERERERESWLIYLLSCDCKSCLADNNLLNFFLNKTNSSWPPHQVLGLVAYAHHPTINTYAGISSGLEV